MNSFQARNIAGAQIPADMTRSGVPAHVLVFTRDKSVNVPTRRYRGERLC